jgi:hypothetical protein
MLSDRLVRVIENHAEELTRSVLHDLASNELTPAYHELPRSELHLRVYDVYRHLGRWITEKAEGPVKESYTALGRTRRIEGIPLSEVVQALLLIRQHLWDYVRSSGLVDTVMELYQEEDLNLRLGRFFDHAVYYTVKGYEDAA